MPGNGLGSFASMEAAMFGIAAIVALALALILRLLQDAVHAGVFLTWQTFTIIGLLCLAVHVTAPAWPWRRAA